MSKLIRACVALAAFAALAVPATASAENDITLQQPTGTSLAPTHASTIPVAGTSIGKTEMLDSSGGVLVSCDTAVMTGNLETNTHTAVEGTITSAAFHDVGGPADPCQGSIGSVTVTPSAATNGLPWCLRSTNTMKTDEFQVRGNNCTGPPRAIRFVLHTAVGQCTYERTGAISGTFTTHPSAAVLSISNQEFKRIAGSFLCPANGFLKMSFALERETAGGSPHPIYIVNAT